MKEEIMIMTFGGELDIRKHLKGKEPKEVMLEGNTTVIVNQDGGKITIDNKIYNLYIGDSRIENGLAETMQSLKKDGTRDKLIYGFPNENDKIEFNKKEFEEMSIVNNIEDFGKQMKEEVVETTLRVIKPDLENRTKWGVQGLGKNISVEIADSEFLDKVHKNEVVFSNGTWMKVDLKIIYFVNDKGIVIEDIKAKYVVTEVKEWGNDLKTQKTLF